MGKKPGDNLKDVTKGLVNVSEQLFRKQPVIFLVFIAILGICFWEFVKSPHRMTFGLCILISGVSIILYIKTNNYAETLLSFMLGVLTIFTVNWDHYTSSLFVLFYLGINIFLFFISSIRMAAKLETILTSAATYIDLQNFDYTYKRLDAICHFNTTYKNFSIIDKAETLKYLAYMKVPIEEMYESISNIELIKVCYQLEIATACDFFRVIYFIKYRTNSSIDITAFLDTIVSKRLPIDPLSFIKILEQTKSCLLSQKLTLLEYLDKIENLAFDGYSDENIIKEMNN